MASPTRWTWVWVNSRSWWWKGRPGALQFMGSQRVGHNWVTELNWTEIGTCLLMGLLNPSRYLQGFTLIIKLYLQVEYDFLCISLSHILVFSVVVWVRLKSELKYLTFFFFWRLLKCTLLLILFEVHDRSRVMSFFFFFNTHYLFYWGIVGLQCCVGSCYTMKWIIVWLWINEVNPHPTPLGHHRAQSWAPCAQQQQLPTSCRCYRW